MVSSDGLARPPAQIHDPLVQVVSDVQLAGLQLPVVVEGELEPPGHLHLPQPEPLAVARQVLHDDREHRQG